MSDKVCVIYKIRRVDGTWIGRCGWTKNENKARIFVRLSAASCVANRYAKTALALNDWSNIEILACEMKSAGPIKTIIKSNGTIQSI